MFDKAAREKSGSLKVARKSGSPRPTDIGIPPKRRKFRVHDQINVSDGGFFGDGTSARAIGRQKSLANAPEAFGDIVPLANQENQVKMATMFEGSHKQSSENNGAAANTRGIKDLPCLIDDREVEPESDHDTLFVGSRSVKLSTERIPETDFDADPEFYDGLPPERRKTTRDYIYLDGLIESMSADMVLHQKKINAFTKEHEAMTFQISDLAARLENDQLSINDDIDREIRALEEKRIVQLKASKDKAEMEQAGLRSKADDCRLKQAAEQAKMEEVWKGTEDVRRRKEAMIAAGSFALGMDVGSVLARMAQKKR
jgi:hypothetical protein